MLELGLSMVIVASGMLGYRIATKYKFHFNKIRDINPISPIISPSKAIVVENEDITEEENLTIKQHFNVLKLIGRRKNKNSIPKDKED